MNEKDDRILIHADKSGNYTRKLYPDVEEGGSTCIKKGGIPITSHIELRIPSSFQCTLYKSMNSNHRYRHAIHSSFGIT